MKTIELKIGGMHCPSCEMLISDVLTDLGIENSAFDSKNGTGTITFDETKITLEEIKKAIESEGYKVE